MEESMRPKAPTALQHALIGIVLATSLGGCVAYTRPAAPAYYGVEVEVAPPPLRVVEVPPPRPGYIWAPGYWRWNGHEHVWAEGRWLPERRGQHWETERWEPHNGRWRFVQGHWER
jgi:WXXGXW repeat (2 copies)